MSGTVVRHKVITSYVNAARTLKYKIAEYDILIVCAKGKQSRLAICLTGITAIVDNGLASV